MPFNDWKSKKASPRLPLTIVTLPSCASCSAGDFDLAAKSFASHSENKVAFAVSDDKAIVLHDQSRRWLLDRTLVCGSDYDRLTGGKIWPSGLVIDVMNDGTVTRVKTLKRHK